MRRMADMKRVLFKQVDSSACHRMTPDDHSGSSRVIQGHSGSPEEIFRCPRRKDGMLCFTAVENNGQDGIG
ncbi:hypothetical protein RRG08_043764 [Elysia crispata]|uniref:Uncharacterized protein n=1 Tax=Elysia crispata TaxID=231223 RepID=A0AAE1BAP8_9GAST|nr:hypothetical protein RRG08_043764 [Elysia crispata]